MVPEYITNRDEVALRTVLVAHQVRKVVKEIAGPIVEYWSDVPLAADLMVSVPDLDAEWEALRKSIPSMSDDDITWLLDLGVGPYLSWLIVKHVQATRPYLLDRKGGNNG